MKVSLLVTFALIVLSEARLEAAAGTADFSQDPAFGGFTIDPVYVQQLVRDGYIPTRPAMSDQELVGKLNLESPQLAEVKAATAKKDQKTLEAALGAYLNSQLKPLHAPVTGKPAPNAKAADKWLQPEIILGKRTHVLGEHMDWFLGSNAGEEFSTVSDWYFAPPMAEAYTATGDPRYAKTLLTFARSFYPTAGRPPAQRPKTWFGFGGPWRSQGLHTRLAYLAVAYRAIGAASCVTDADRVMFLKMFWEHCDALYQMADRPIVQNFAGAILDLVDTAVILPDFRDSPKWMERSKTFFASMVTGMTSDDGGPLERSGYGYGVISGLRSGYVKFRAAGATPPASALQRLEKSFEYEIFLPSPTWLCPMFGHGTPQSLQGHMSGGADLFPEREDFAYVVSGGKTGKPPARTARNFWVTGLAMMRSDWSQDALYMALNYNGCPWGVDQHPEFLSFALQANGRLYMTNPGTTKDYGLGDEANWCEQTVAANTVAVDHESQKTMDNGGRLESWENLPGFGYMAAISRGYEWMGVRHRRAILFMKPFASPGPKHGYWVVYDRLDGNGRPHEYRWMGHFQPTELKVDAFTKMVETSTVDGNRLYLKSAEPYGNFGFEQGSAPIQGVDGKGGSALLTGPYISLVRSSADPVAFRVLLYPATKDDKPPLFEPLPVREGDRPTAEMPHQEACSQRHTEEAVGFRVSQGDHEDWLAISQSPVLRTYGRWGQSIRTDGEAGYVRRTKGLIVEAGLVRGQQLNFSSGADQSKRFIEASPAIAAVGVRYAGDKVEITTRGVGKLGIAKLSATQATLNGKPVTVKEEKDLMTIAVPSVSVLTLTPLVFSTDARALCQQTGVPYGADFGPDDWGSYSKGPEHSVLVKWDSSTPSDAEVEYREVNAKTWKRSVNGELLAQHQFVISEIEPGKEYEFRITCRSEEGALASNTATYQARLKK